MKKVLSLLLLCSTLLLSLTACMSDEEKQQAKENERIAKPAIERYVEQNYSGATVRDVKCLTYTGGSVFPETYATDCVNAKVSYKNKTFNVVVNLETKEFYNDYYRQDIEKELKNLLYSELSIEKPKDLELKFISRSIWTNVDGGWGYHEEDIDSAEDVLYSSEYKVYAVCKYAGSNMDFERIPVKNFFKSSYKSDIELFFINYRNAQRYIDDEEISGGYAPTTFLNNTEEIYSIEEIKTASKQYTDNAFGEIDESVDFQEYEEDYVHNKSEVYNGVEFVWDDNTYDIDFSTVKADPVITTEYYSREPFYAKKSNAIKLDCTRRTTDKPEFNKSVYMFFGNSLKDDYLITDNNGDVDVSTLYGAMNNKCCYQYVTLNDMSHEITLGIYKRAEEEQSNY